MTTKNKVFLIALLAFAMAAAAACQPNATILKDAPPPPTPMSTAELKETSIDEDLKEMRVADFDYILVFRRKDGGVFQKEDTDYLRANTPIETNRWRRSDGGKAYIAGSGFGFSPEQMAALAKRFVIDDQSKPEVKDKKAANANNKPKEK